MSRGIRAAVTLAVTAGAALLLIAPAANAGGSCHEPRETKTGTEVITNEGCFGPNILQVQPGEEVTFRNPSDIDHTVTGLGDAWGGELSAGEVVRVAFDEAGVYPYFCHYHLGMIGTVVVGDALVPAVANEPAGTSTDTALGAAAAGTTSSGPPAAAVGILAAGAGFGAGLVLRGRLRLPKPARGTARSGGVSGIR